MYEFMDRLVSVVLPRIRDFRGVSGLRLTEGQLQSGFKDQLMFPEIDYDKVEKPRGFQITIVTTARSDEEGSVSWSSWDAVCERLGNWQRLLRSSSGSDLQSTRFSTTADVSLWSPSGLHAQVRSLSHLLPELALEERSLESRSRVGEAV